MKYKTFVYKVKGLLAVNLELVWEVDSAVTMHKGNAFRKNGVLQGYINNIDYEIDDTGTEPIFLIKYYLN
ncbi:hypothetical protein [Risungbinella massiliensis]|uniref:hypothetical protein n=1 Tax=Risungbinella massiliensis TaxID=1329796 RepID=UPI0005CC6448|nr:hypothetical protein [Risungbinella massiliensis]